MLYRYGSTDKTTDHAVIDKGDEQLLSIDKRKLSGAVVACRCSRCSYRKLTEEVAPADRNSVENMLSLYNLYCCTDIESLIKRLYSFVATEHT